MVPEVFLHVVHYNGLAQTPPDFLQVLDIYSSAQKGVLSVESMTHDSMRVQFVYNPISVVLLSRGEYDDFEIRGEFKQKLICEGSDLELFKLGGLVEMYQRLVQVQDQSILFLGRLCQKGNAQLLMFLLHVLFVITELHCHYPFLDEVIAKAIQEKVDAVVNAHQMNPLGQLLYSDLNLSVCERRAILQKLDQKLDVLALRREQLLRQQVLKRLHSGLDLGL